MTDRQRHIAAPREATPEPRAVRRARTRAERASVVSRGPRSGRPTRGQRRALTVVRLADERRAEDLETGRAMRASTRFERAGTMPHRPSGKHQEKLEKRKEARRGTRETPEATA